MLIFIASFIQMATHCLSIPILLKERLGMRTFFIMLIGAQTIGYSLLPAMGAMSSLVVLVFLMGCIYFKIRRVLISTIIPVVPMILMVISDYSINLIMLLIFHISNAEFQQNHIYLLLGVTGIMIMTLLLSLAGRYIFRKIRGNDLFFKRYGLLFTVLSVLTLATFYINIWIGKQQGFSDENIRANSILFFFYFILLLIVCVVLMRTVMKETNIQNQQVQYERLTEYTQNLECLYMDMQKFRHDYINILLTMSEYIRCRDIDRLQHYFEQKIMPISQGMQSNNFKLGALHNVKLQELKGILSSKLIRAQELNINAVIEVVEPIEKVNMDSLQLCRCLGIILDNAIEEAVQCERPTVNVAVIKREYAVLIVVTNSCREEVPQLFKLYERGFSTKGTNRGIGLSTLKEIVSHCNTATLDTQIKDGEFIQQLAISSIVTTAMRVG